MNNNIVLLRPYVLYLGLLILPLLFLAARRLSGLARWRKWSALALQSLGATLLLGALAEPAFVKPDASLSLVLVLDASASVSEASRQQDIAYAKNVLASANSSQQVRFVAAGGQAVTLTPGEVADGSWGSGVGDQGSGGGGAATQNSKLKTQNSSDLAAGLRLAGSLVGDSGPRRVVLVSDGWETQGSAADEAARLKARGVDLQVVGLSALGSPEVVVEGLSTSPYVRIGDTIASELSVFSTSETSATLRISVDGTTGSTRRLALKKGENTLPLEQKAAVEGFHSIHVALEASDDTSNENNSADATVVVKPKPNVLVLEDRVGEGALLADALTRSQMNVDVRSSSEVPAQLGELDGYDSIILNNVAATSLTLDQQRTLQEYVRRNGRGLVAVGGQTSYAKGGYADSVLEDVLPLSSHPAPRPQKGATALIMVFDRSGSMDLPGSTDEVGVTKLVMAKEAARLAVDSLRDGDTLGVLGFDTLSDWVVPVQQINGSADKEQAKQLISGITSGAGTAIFQALYEAAQALRKVSAPNRHLVLLTDGQDYRSPPYEPLLDQLHTDNISLSTIGIGSDADKELLTRLAKLGLGRYYFTERPQQIPKIVFKELDVTLKEAVINGQVQPHTLASTPLLRGFSPQDIPELGGYDITIPKEDAVVGLTSDQGDPLLAHWNYGLGRVVAFTSDTAMDWGAQWATWNDFARFWSQAVRWTMASPVNRQLQPDIKLRIADCGLRIDCGDSVISGSVAAPQLAIISVESLNADNTFADLANISAGLRGPSGVVTTTLLMQTAPGRYEADVPLAELGAYEVRLSREGGEGATETAGFSVPPSAELLHAGTNDRLLKRINGGKEYIAQPSQALNRSGLSGASSELQPLWAYLVAPALVLLLLSVAARRLDIGRGKA